MCSTVHNYDIWARSFPCMTFSAYYSNSFHKTEKQAGNCFDHNILGSLSCQNLLFVVHRELLFSNCQFSCYSVKLFHPWVSEVDSSIIEVWTYPLFQIGMSVRNKNRMANSVDSADPDETANYEPSYLDIHCLQKYHAWFAELKAFDFSFIIYLSMLFF